MSDLIEKMQQLNSAHNTFMEKFDGRLAAVEKEIDSRAVEEGRAGMGTGSPAPASNKPGYVNAKTGEAIPVYGKADKLNAAAARSDWSLADFVRGSMGLEVRGEGVLERGSATVPEYVSTQIIDRIRAKNRLVQAGAATLNIDGPTNVCRIDGDATVHQHTEGAEDIAFSDPTLAPVKVDPKALVALVPLSMELVQDSANIDAALQMSIAAAFAGQIDVIGLAKLLADAGIPESATAEDTASWSGILDATGSALGKDQDVPRALIANTADFTSRAKQLAGEGGWLGAPPLLADMLDLPTTSMTEGHAVLGNFELAVALAVRASLRLEIIRFQQPKKASHLLVAHARLEPYIVQPDALYRALASVT